MTRIKQLITLLLIVILSGAGLNAQDNKANKHFLWEVKSDSATVYLFGSIHMGKKELYPLDSIIERSFGHSDALVMELDISNADQGEMLSALTFQDSTTIEDHISDTTLKKLKDFLQQKMMPYPFVKNFKPEFLFLTVTGMEYMKLGYLPKYGLEMHFMDQLGQREILELETVEDQLAALSVDTNEMSMDLYVQYSIDEFENSLEQIEDLFAAWKNGDDQKLLEIISKSVEDNPDYKPIMDELLDNRNFKMADKIEKFFNNNRTYFVIVGAAHLIGENGVVNLLKQKNIYKIKRL